LYFQAQAGRTVSSSVSSYRVALSAFPHHGESPAISTVSHPPRDGLRSVLLTVAVDVDVKPLFGHVVPELAYWVMVVSNDLLPPAVEPVLELHDEAGDVPAVVTVTESDPSDI